MKVDVYDIPEHYYYIKEHEWLSIADEAPARIGITDYAQKTLREITYFYPGMKGAKVEPMETLCKIESRKCTAEIFSPVSGKIIRFNDDLLDDPSIINLDPYDKGWIVLFHPTNLKNELKKLLTPELYANYLKELTKIDKTLLIHRWKTGIDEKDK